MKKNQFCSSPSEAELYLNWYKQIKYIYKYINILLHTNLWKLETKALFCQPVQHEKISNIY